MLAKTSWFKKKPKEDLYDKKAKHYHEDSSLYRAIISRVVASQGVGEKSMKIVQ